MDGEEEQGLKDPWFDVLDGALDEGGLAVGLVFPEETPPIHPADDGKPFSGLGFENIPSVINIGEDVEFRFYLSVRLLVADGHIPVEIMREPMFR